MVQRGTFRPYGSRFSGLIFDPELLPLFLHPALRLTPQTHRWEYVSAGYDKLLLGVTKQEHACCPTKNRHPIPDVFLCRFQCSWDGALEYDEKMNEKRGWVPACPLA